MLYWLACRLEIGIAIKTPVTYDEENVVEPVRAPITLFCASAGALVFVIFTAKR